MKDISLKDHLKKISALGWQGKLKKYGAAGAKKLMSAQSRKYWDKKKAEKRRGDSQIPLQPFGENQTMGSQRTGAISIRRPQRI